MLCDMRSPSLSPPRRDPLSPISPGTTEPFQLTTQGDDSPLAVSRSSAVIHNATHSSFSRHEGSFGLSGPNFGGIGLHPVTTTTSPPDYLDLTSPHRSISSNPPAPARGSDRTNAVNHTDGLSHVSSEMLNSPEALHRKVGLLLYEDRMQLPFKVPREALLFHHYMEALAALVGPPRS